MVSPGHWPFAFHASFTSINFVIKFWTLGHLRQILPELNEGGPGSPLEGGMVTSAFLAVLASVWPGYSFNVGFAAYALSLFTREQISKGALQAFTGFVWLSLTVDVISMYMDNTGQGIDLELLAANDPGRITAGIVFNCLNFIVKLAVCGQVAQLLQPNANGANADGYEQV